MSEQPEVVEVGEPPQGDESFTTTGDGFVTPRTPGLSQKSGTEEFRTPNQTPIRNRVLDLVKGGFSSKSPGLKIPASPVMERLGYGTGVGVYLLQRSPRVGGEALSPWALKKTAKVDETSDLYAARIEFEAGILKQLSHPNIIGYRAFGKQSPDIAYLAMEKASKSLGDLIDERVEEVMLFEDCDQAAPFPAKKMEKVALDVAKALTYLHEEMKMIHGDLKSANVLVFGDFEVIKLCDFGVSRKLKKDGTLEGSYVGTQIWNPMEVILADRGKTGISITQRADIYPFGLTIHEMITLKPPHLSGAEDSYLESLGADDSCSEISADGTENKTSSTINVSFDDDAYENALAVLLGTRPPLPGIEFDSSYNTILGVFYCCTDEDPTKRPDAKDIVAALETDLGN